MAVVHTKPRSPLRASQWLVLTLAPILAWYLSTGLPAWIRMWLLTLAILAGLKWLTYARYVSRHRTPTLGMSFGYLLGWPGLDPVAFFAKVPVSPSRGEWSLAVGKVVLGMLLLLGLVRPALTWHPLLAGWVGLVGMAFTFHFGLLHLLSLVWRRAGVDAAPIMNWPVLASSVADFWSRRWNLAFRDVAHDVVFRPLVGRIGAVGAMLSVFVVSGLLHDVVISLSAGDGYGRPSMYFGVQAVGLFLQRRLAGLRRPLAGRLFTVCVVVAPVAWLFHAPFVYEVVIPMLRDLHLV